MKRFIFLFLCALLTLSLSACSAKPTSSTPSSTGNNAAVANPFTDCDTLAEAEALAGFSFTAPEHISEKTASRRVRAIPESMIELIYQDEAGIEQARLRKAPGEADISGDYGQYQEVSSVCVGDLRVTMKGNNGSVNAATWTQDGASFSVTTATGMTSDTMTAFIQAVR